MRNEDRGRTRLKLVRGGGTRVVRLGGVTIVPAPAAMPPFPVDAEVVEEDTYFVLGAEPTVAEVDEHVVRLMTEAIEVQPAEPGSVSVRRGMPLKLLAVVHDLDRMPSWREEWVERALREVFWEVERRGLGAIALPMIGTLHGALRPDRFAELLRGIMCPFSFSSLRRLWLVAHEDAAAEAMRVLEGGCDA
ncbi:MAG: hypothetical protein ABFD98_09930 [Syntrophobacteraceae bacterium]|nr:hypothetical protein [Desulfobacteraceae bacterium]